MSITNLITRESALVVARNSAKLLVMGSVGSILTQKIYEFVKEKGYFTESEIDGVTYVSYRTVKFKRDKVYVNISIPVSIIIGLFYRSQPYFPQETFGKFSWSVAIGCNVAAYLIGKIYEESIYPNLPDCPFDSIKNNSYYRSFSATVLSAPFKFVSQGVLNGLSGQGLTARLFTGSIFYCNQR